MAQLHDLIHYLQETGRISPNEQPKIRELAGGVSSHTVLVERNNGEAWVIKQALAKLRVTETDWFCDPARIHHEAEGLRWLERLAPPGTTTPLVFEDRDQNLLAMTAVPQPHDTWKDLLLQGQIDDDSIRQFSELLAAIHRMGDQHRDELLNVFADTRFFETLRLEPYYSYAAEQVPEANDFLQALIASTRERQDTLVHGDFSPKNILVHHHKLILIDHEVIHFGDAAFDLGFSMTHLLSKAHHLPAHRDAFANAATLYWKTYREALGDVPFSTDIEERAVRHTLGCLLARVAGRSPLEYLSQAERAKQQDAVVHLIARDLTTLPSLIESFIGVL